MGDFPAPFVGKQTNFSPHVKIGRLFFTDANSIVKIAYDGKLLTEPIYLTISNPPPNAYPTDGTMAFLPNAFTPFPRWVTNDIAVGPKRTLWFDQCVVVPKSCKIMYLSAAGNAVVAGKVPWVQGLIEGPDGNIWFTEGENFIGSKGPTIGRITPSGKVTEFLLQNITKRNVGYGTFSLIVAHDKSIWFTELDAIGNITTDGHFTEYPITDTTIGPVRSQYLVEGRPGVFYFDGIADRILKFNSRTHVLKALGDYYHQLSGPVVPARDGVIAFSAGKGEVYVDSQGNQTPLQSPAANIADIPALNLRGTFFGGGFLKGPTILEGVSVLTLHGNALRGLAYPAPATLLPDFEKIVHDGSTFWGIALPNGSITRFTYDP